MSFLCIQESEYPYYDQLYLKNKQQKWGTAY